MLNRPGIFRIPVTTSNINDCDLKACWDGNFSAYGNKCRDGYQCSIFHGTCIDANFAPEVVVGVIGAVISFS